VSETIDVQSEVTPQAQPNRHTPIPQTLLTPEIRNRFMSKVALSADCWIWTGNHLRKRGSEYGLFKIGTSNLLASRVAYALHHKADPGSSKVLHCCDNPACVKPEHLFLGTQKHNMEDMVSKGRRNHVHGERHPLSKLTVAKVKEIRALRLAGKHSLNALAARFGVDKKAIQLVVQNRTWREQ
jgi:hypothetical protein